MTLIMCTCVLEVPGIVEQVNPCVKLQDLSTSALCILSIHCVE